MWGVSLPRVGNISNVTNPGLTTIAYLRHAARSTRPPLPYQQSHQLIIHLLLWDDDAEITTVAASGSDAEGMVVSGSDAEERDSGRAERAVPRRGTIVVSPTQVVPEVLAVWGSDFKRRDSVS